MQNRIGKLILVFAMLVWANTLRAQCVGSAYLPPDTLFTTDSVFTKTYDNCLKSFSSCTNYDFNNPVITNSSNIAPPGLPPARSVMPFISGNLFRLFYSFGTKPNVYGSYYTLQAGLESNFASRANIGVYGSIDPLGAEIITVGGKNAVFYLSSSPNRLTYREINNLGETYVSPSPIVILDNLPAGTTTFSVAQANNSIIIGTLGSSGLVTLYEYSALGGTIQTLVTFTIPLTNSSNYLKLEFFDEKLFAIVGGGSPKFCTILNFGSNFRVNPNPEVFYLSDVVTQINQPVSGASLFASRGKLHLGLVTSVGSVNIIDLGSSFQVGSAQRVASALFPATNTYRDLRVVTNNNNIYFFSVSQNPIGIFRVQYTDNDCEDVFSATKTEAKNHPFATQSFSTRLHHNGFLLNSYFKNTISIPCLPYLPDSITCGQSNGYQLKFSSVFNGNKLPAGYRLKLTTPAVSQFIDTVFTLFPGAWLNNSNLSIYRGVDSLMVVSFYLAHFPKPSPDFSISGLKCSGGSIVFASTSDTSLTQMPLNYQWSFGDNKFGQGKSTTHIFDSSKTYQVTMSIANCDTSITKPITLAPGPATDFTISDICVGDSTIFSNVTINPQGTVQTSLMWFIGNDSLPELNTVKRKFADTGVYNVQLRVNNDQNCPNIMSKAVRIHQLPVPIISGPDTGFVGQIFNFSDVSFFGAHQTLDSSYWQLNYLPSNQIFQTKSGSPFILSHDSVSDYRMRLISVSNNGCRDTTNKNYSVFNYCPVARVAKSLPIASVGDTITFANQSLYGQHYQWFLHGHSLANRPLAQALYTLPTGLGVNSPRNIDYIEDGGKHFLLVAGSSSANFSVLDIDNPISGSVSTARVITLNGGTLSTPVRILPFIVGSQRGAFILNQTANSTISIIRFSAGFSGSEANVLGVLPAQTGIMINDLKFIQEGNTKILLAATSNGRIVQYSFSGDSINPSLFTTHEHIISSSGLALSSIDLVKNCNGYLGFAITSTAPQRIFALSFADGFLSTPSVTDLTSNLIDNLNQQVFLSNPRMIRAALDGQYLYGVVANGTSLLSVLRVNLSNPSMVRVLFNASVSNGSSWLGLNLYSNYKEKYFFAVTSGGLISRIKFPGLTIPKVIENNNSNLKTYFQEPGKYYVGIQATDRRNNLNIALDSIFVSGNNATIPSSLSIIKNKSTVCLQDSIKVQPNVNNNINVSDVKWDMCAGDLGQNANINLTTTMLVSGMQARAYDIIYDSVSKNWVGLVLDNVNNFAYMLRFKNGINSTPIISSAMNFGGRLRNPTDIELIYDEGRIRAFIANNSATAPTNILRIDFDALAFLNFLSPSETDITQFTTAIRPFRLATFSDVKLGKFVFVISQTHSEILAFEFFNSFNNNPINYFLPGISNLGGFTTGFSDIEIERSADRIGFLLPGVGAVTGIYTASFVNDFTSLAKVSVWSAPLLLGTFTGIQMAYEAGNLYAYLVHNQPSQITTINRYTLNRNFEPITTNPFFVGNINATSDKLKIAHYNSEWVALALGRTNLQVHTISWPNNCGFVGRAEVNNQSHGGYYETLGNPYKRISSLGFVNNFYLSAIDSVLITNPFTVQFAVGGNRCPSDTVIFTNQTVLGSGSVSEVIWDFGDGSYDTSNILKPTVKHVYTNVGTYQVTLFVRSGVQQCVNFIRKSVEIKPYPVVSIGLDSSSLCAFSNIKFRAISDSIINPISTYLWTFPNNISTTIKNPVVAIADSGAQSVSLTVTSEANCKASATININLLKGVQADFTSTGVCSADSMQFTSSINLFGASLGSVNWTFPKQLISNIQNPKILPDTFGLFDAKLVVTNNLGCVTEVIKPLTIYRTPTAVIEPSEACINDTLDFYLNQLVTQGSIASYLWDFGQGIVSSEPTPSHLFTDTGYHLVKVTFATIFGCVGQTEQLVYLKSSPISNFSFTNQCQGTPIQFLNLTNANGAGPNLTFEWNFGNGTFSNLGTPSGVFYNASGTYNVTLTTTGVNGCSNKVLKQVSVYHLPVADFSVIEACKGKPYYFASKSFVTGGDSIVKSEWSIGGESYLGDSIKHIFPFKADEGVSLSVTTNRGCSRATSKVIQVLDSPIADFLATTTFLSRSVDFDNSSKGANYYLWNFGNITDTTTSPTFAFPSDGEFEVRLNAYLNDSCYSTKSQLVFVTTNPICDLKLNNIDIVYTNATATFVASVTNNGNYAIVNPTFDLRLADGTLFNSGYLGSISPRETKACTLGTRLPQVDLMALQSVCITTLPECNDIKISDNDSCFVAGNQFIFGDVRPNPAKNSANVSVVIPSDGLFNLSVHNILGQKVTTFANGTYQKGAYQFFLNLNHLTRGSYHLVAEFEGRKRSQILILVE